MSGFLVVDYDMGEPGCELVVGIVVHGTLFGCGVECVGNVLGGVFVVGREGNLDMVVVEDGVVFVICFFDLV